MSTPEESFETAMDESSDDAAREEAIDALEAANECASLAAVVERDDVADRFRRQALDALATPQCDSALRRLSEHDALDASLREDAERLLEDVEDIDPA